MTLGAAYYQLEQPERAVEVFDHAVASPALTYNQAANIVQIYSLLGAKYFDKLEAALKKMAALAPDMPEAHYDLAAIEAVHGETDDALEQLRVALQLNSARLKTNPSAKNLLQTNLSDRRFDRLRNLPEYQKIISQ